MSKQKPEDRSEFLKLARDRFKQGQDADQQQRERELEDLRFYAGDQWDKGILDSRKGQTLGSGSNQQVVPARPSLTINKTREPVRQVLNQERQSDLTVELIPADDFGDANGPIDHTEIELREGLVRRIQRDSEAADARTWAFSRAAIAGRGYYTVMTRFVPGKTWDQEVYVERIYNQASVVVDPSHEQPDASDADWYFYGRDMSWDEYQAENPNRDSQQREGVTNADEEWRALGDDAPDWFKTTGDVRSVRVMNYFYTTRTTRELALMTDGSVGWVDELAEDAPKPTDKRTVVEKAIKWAKIDGAQVLDETDWPGHYLNIVKVIGEELQPYDTERRCEGIVRPMRDACKGNNYIISKFVERVGLTPISPWMMAGGQDETYEAEYDALNTRALSRVHYNQKDNFGQPAPPPFRADARAEIADIGMGVQLFGQAIASTSVVPETALGNVDPSVKSGKLAKALIEQANRGTSNFLDNLTRSMRHEARIVNDLLFPIYGRPGRLARMMNTAGEMSSVIIGQPFTVQGQGPNAKPVPVQAQQQPGQPPQAGVKQYTLTKDAEFNVAVKITKNEGTRREQEVETLGEMIQADPQLMQVFGDLFFKYQDGPGHEEMSERMKAVLIPPVQALLNGGQAPSNPQDQQKIQALMQQLQETSQLADKNKTDLQKTQMDNTTKLQIANAELQSKEKLALIQQAGALAAVDAKIDAENARTFVDAAESKISKELELHMVKLTQVHEALTQQADHKHEVAMAAANQDHALASSALGHAQALEQGQQAADLAPEPAETPA